VDVGILEGSISNEEDLHKAQEFRKHCKLLISLGDCAVNGNVPAMRNPFKLDDVIERAYRDNVDLNPQIPTEGVPALLPSVKPIHGVVDVDVFVPGCPPHADAIHYVLSELIAGRTPDPSSRSRASAPELPRSRRPGTDSHTTTDQSNGLLPSHEPHHQHRTGHPHRGPCAHHAAAGRHRRGRRRQVPPDPVPRLREVLRGPPLPRDAGAHRAHLRHLPGQPPAGLQQGLRRPARGDHPADGREAAPDHEPGAAAAATR
jgi:NAD-reducing hydrogenase small subunit